MLDKACQRFDAGIKISAGEIIHRGLRYELVPVRMLISAAVSFHLLTERSRVTYFMFDKANGRAAMSQGDVGTRLKKYGLEQYSCSSDLILPLLASDTPVLALDVLRA